jgi:hypothetical protein
MRRSRMTTRRWMVAVAVVGLLLGVVVEGWRLKQRGDYYLQQANDLARLEKYWRSDASRIASGPPLQQPPVTFVVVGQTHTVAEVAAEYAKVAAYYAKRKQTYLHPASRPWISVPPDRRAVLIPVIRAVPSPTAVIEKSGRPLPESGESPSP